MPQLPEPKEILKQTQQIAKIIKLILFAIETTPTIKRIYTITSDFTLVLVKESTDIYVIHDVLFIPLMTAEKLNNLSKYLNSVQLPYVFEHEACHLLDNKFCTEHNLEIQENILEKRAENIENLCKELS